MPVRNESSFIRKSLGSVVQQDYPSDRMEILIVDGMSDDETPQLVTQMSSTRQYPKIELLKNPRQIVPTAFNIGLGRARGEVIVRVDGHCTLAEDYVRRCVETLEKTGADNVGGCQVPVGTTVVGKAVAIATCSPFGIGNAAFHYATEPGWVDTVYLGAWPRSVFDRIGGFDEDLVRNQDDEFNFRLKQQGGRIWLNPDISSTYYCRASLRHLWRQYYQYGNYKVLVAKKRRGISSWRHLVPATFVAAILGASLAALWTSNPIWLAPVLLPYLLASIAFSIWEARRNVRTLPLLPIVFAILHFSYGAGFLTGLWRWRRGPAESSGNA